MRRATRSRLPGRSPGRSHSPVMDTPSTSSAAPPDSGPATGARRHSARAARRRREPVTASRGRALATAMLVGRKLPLDCSNDRAQVLDVGNVIMIMHGLGKGMPKGHWQRDILRSLRRERMLAPSYRPRTATWEDDLVRERSLTFRYENWSREISTVMGT